MKFSFQEEEDDGEGKNKREAIQISGFRRGS